MVQHLLHLAFPQYTAQERSQNLLELWSSLFSFQQGWEPFLYLSGDQQWTRPTQQSVGQRQDAVREQAGGMPLTPEQSSPSMGQQSTSQQEIPYCRARERTRAQTDLTGLNWCGWASSGAIREREEAHCSSLLVTGAPGLPRTQQQRPSRVQASVTRAGRWHRTAAPSSAASQARRVHSSHPCSGRASGTELPEQPRGSSCSLCRLFPRASTCVTQTPDTVSPRSQLSCAPGPAGSPGSSPPSGLCISAAASAGAAGPRGTRSPPAAASCSRRPGPSPAAAASSPPGRSLWPSGGKSRSVSTSAALSAHLWDRGTNSLAVQLQLHSGSASSTLRQPAQETQGYPAEPGPETQLCSEHQLLVRTDCGKTLSYWHYRGTATGELLNPPHTHTHSYPHHCYHSSFDPIALAAERF